MTPSVRPADLVAETRAEAERQRRLIPFPDIAPEKDERARIGALLDRLADALSDGAVIDHAVEGLTVGDVLGLCGDMAAARETLNLVSGDAGLRDAKAALRSALLRGAR